MPNLTKVEDWAKTHKPQAIAVAAVGGALVLAVGARAFGGSKTPTVGVGSSQTVPAGYYANTTDGTLLSWKSPQGSSDSGYGLGGAYNPPPPPTASQTSGDQGIPQAVTQPVSLNFGAPKLPGEKFVDYDYIDNGKGGYATTNYGGIYTAGDATLTNGGLGSYLGLGSAGQGGDANLGTPNQLRQFSGLTVDPTGHGYTLVSQSGVTYHFADA